MINGESSYRRFLSGDEAAFEEIMKAYFDNLIFFINRYVKDVHAAEDIAIDSFAYILANKRRYNFKVTFKTYLFMIAKSRALNYIRHNKTVTLVPLDDARQIADSKSVEDTVLKNEISKKVSAAIDTLSEDMKIAVHLVYFEQLSYKQAAAVMKKTPKQVDNILYRAKCELRIILGKDGEQLL